MSRNYPLRAFRSRALIGEKGFLRVFLHKDQKLLNYVRENCFRKYNKREISHDVPLP